MFKGKIKIKSDTVAAVLIALTPILEYFKSPIYVYSIGTFVPLLLVPLLLNKKSVFFIRKEKFLILLFAAIQIFSFISKLFHGYGFSGLGTMLFCIASMIFYGMLSLDQKPLLEKVKTIIIAVSIINTIMLILQYISFYILHRYFVFAPINLYLDGIYEKYYFQVTTGFSGPNFRPCGLFVEPSHLATYSLFGLACSLFRKTTGRRNIYLSLCITLGIVLSTSGLGIVCSIGLWGLYYLLEIINGHVIKILPKILMLLTASVVILTLLFQTTTFRPIIQSYFDAYIYAKKGMGDKVKQPLTGRTGNYEDFFSLPTEEKLWGMGYQVKSGYLTTFNDVLYNMGIIGICIYYMIFCSLLNKKDSFTKAICVLMMVLSFIISIDSCGYIAFYFFLINGGNLKICKKEIAISAYKIGSKEAV